MKPDVIPTTDVKALLGKGDVAIMLLRDSDPMVEKVPLGTGFYRWDIPHNVLLVSAPFGPLVPGTFLRFRSLTGDTDWGGIAEYCSIFDGAHEITKYLTKQAVGTKDEEHG